MNVADKTEQRRYGIAQAAAAHLIDHGLHRSALRDIANTIGVSERMLVYYFGTKEALIRESMMIIGEQLIAGLGESLGDRKISPKVALARLKRTMSHPDVVNVIRLWFEMVGLAMRGEEPYQSSAAELMALSEQAIRQRLESRYQSQAVEVLHALEGWLIVQLLDPPLLDTDCQGGSNP
jgi:AcrR family transcriptional regulator